MIQPKKMIRDAAGTLWSVSPMAVTIFEEERGSSVFAIARCGERTLEARGKTQELAQHALIVKLQRRLARGVVKQMRVLSKQAGQKLPHRFSDLPIPLPRQQFEAVCEKLHRYEKRVGAASAAEKTGEQVAA